MVATTRSLPAEAGKTLTSPKGSTTFLSCDMTTSPERGWFTGLFVYRMCSFYREWDRAVDPDGHSGLHVLQLHPLSLVDPALHLAALAADILVVGHQPPRLA